MSQTLYNTLMSNLLNEKHTLAKLRAELEGRRGKLCQYCKGFKYLARNCGNKRREEKRTIVPQNKFKVLKSRAMQCGVEESMIRRVEVVEVECFKCGEKGHKYRECPLWVRKERVAHVARPQKVQQEERLVYPMKGEVQERRLRRTEEEEVVHVAEPQEAQ